MLSSHNVIYFDKKSRLVGQVCGGQKYVCIFFSFTKCSYAATSTMIMLKSRVGGKTKVIYKVMVSGMEWTVFPDRMCGKH